MNLISACHRLYQKSTLEEAFSSRKHREYKRDRKMVGLPPKKESSCNVSLRQSEVNPVLGPIIK